MQGLRSWQGWHDNSLASAQIPSLVSPTMPSDIQAPALDPLSSAGCPGLSDPQSWILPDPVCPRIQGPSAGTLAPQPYPWIHRNPIPGSLTLSRTLAAPPDRLTPSLDPTVGTPDSSPPLDPGSLALLRKPAVSLDPGSAGVHLLWRDC